LEDLTQIKCLKINLEPKITSSSKETEITQVSSPPATEPAKQTKSNSENSNDINDWLDDLITD
jgi:hypothetical protein